MLRSTGSQRARHAWATEPQPPLRLSSRCDLRAVVGSRPWRRSSGRRRRWSGELENRCLETRAHRKHHHVKNVRVRGTVSHSARQVSGCLCMFGSIF